MKDKFSIGMVMMCVIFIAPSVLAQSDNFGQTWYTGVSWGQAASRWELRGGERKMRPDSWRVTFGKANLWQIYQSKHWDVALDIEGNFYHWDDPFRERSISTVSLVPIIRASTYTMQYKWFFGIGIGIAALDSDVWMDRQLGSHWQFEDRIELGVRLQHHQLALGLSHFSNANLADINHGVNIYHFSYSYAW